MLDYSQGKIYKLISDQTDKIYIGSTVEPYLSRRLTGHKVAYNAWKTNTNTKYCSSFEILKNDNYKIVLLELFPCNSKDVLCAKEQEWIDNLKENCVNKNKSYTGINTENMAEYQKLYYAENAEKHKKFRRENAEILAEYQKKYRQEHSKRIAKSRNTQFKCNCGSILTRTSKSNHERTKKHQAYIATL